MTKQSMIRKFDRQAKSYEKRRNSDKTFKYRKKIFSMAEGRVLESAIGVGMNYPYYPDDIELTGIDFSAEMLKSAETASWNYSFEATFIQGDTESVEFEESSFDTVVSSLSLCAYQNPEAVLRQFQKWCRPGGKILLMEHGLSSSRILAFFQKLLDPLTLKIVGCHQKRDITKLVRDSKLKIIKEERYMAGCLYLIQAEGE